MTRGPSAAGAGRKPPSTRQLRAGELIRRALIEAIAEGLLRDPVLAGASVTGSEVRASPDLKHAHAFLLPLGELRHAPELHFELDRSFDEGAKLETLLRSEPVRRDLD